MIRWIASGRQRVAHAYLGGGGYVGVSQVSPCGVARDPDDKAARGLPRCKRCLRALGRECAR